MSWAGTNHARYASLVLLSRPRRYAFAFVLSLVLLYPAAFVLHRPPSFCLWRHPDSCLWVIGLLSETRDCETGFCFRRISQQEAQRCSATAPENSSRQQGSHAVQKITRPHSSGFFHLNRGSLNGLHLLRNDHMPAAGSISGSRCSSYSGPAIDQL